MAVINTVLYETSGNLRILSTSQMDAIKDLVAYLYEQNPTETLTVVTSGGNLSPSMTDRRYQAGEANLTTNTWATEAATDDISAVDTTYDRVSRTRASASSIPGEPVENATNTAFPIYWDGANKQIRSMTQTDFFDTFIAPVITDGLVGTGSVNKRAAGTYTVLTNSSSISGNPGTTIVSSTPIFVDTRADASAYTAAGIEETQDQPTTINNYYLHKITQTSKPSTQAPLFMRTDGTGVQVYTASAFETLLSDYVRSATYGKSGYSITYEMGTSVSNQKGTNINDTYLSGSSADGYTQYRVSASDYRTQEFPNGSVAILNSYKLGITTGVSYSVSASVSSVNEGGTVTFTVTTTNVTPGNIPYSITGIQSADLSAGSLTGNVTTTGSYSSATGTTSITLDNDTTTEGTETIVFSAGGKSVSVTVNDTSQTIVETVSLEGTTSSPENNGSYPITDGSINMGWRFASDGAVRNYNADRVPQYGNSSHTDWINTTPSVTYYIRATIHDDASNSSATTTNSPSALNTWLALTTNRTFLFEDNSGSNSYGQRHITWKIEISDDSGGSNILDTGYYQNLYEGGA